MQGYSQGEPIGYAGMAAPFAAPAAVATAKALAPKAGMMAENYMVRQGMIQPLTAYHGTPHTIQGQFDINKVGTGEGAQAYGHGMYFAESPSVASGYAKTLGQRKAGYEIDGVRITPERGSIEDMAVNLATSASGVNAKNPFEYAKNRALELVKQNPQMQEVAKKIEELQSLGADLKTSGNLYKVEIPDADIPFMLDYDKPFAKQTPEVQAALKNMGSEIKFGSNKESVADFVKLTGDLPPYFKRETGNGIYAELSKQLGGSKQASEYLNSLGIKGTKYLDQQSRGKSGTSNFVVFEPSQVKILEQNSKPVTRKDLIEKQVKALKE
jgi:hypothetical protein